MIDRKKEAETGGLDSAKEAYLSPETVTQIENEKSMRVYAEKNDVFSLGVTLLQDYLSLPTKDLRDLNSENGQEKIGALLASIEEADVRRVLEGMLRHNPELRFDFFDVIELCHEL